MTNAINQVMDDTLRNNKRSILIGEDVEFGGVFRCSDKLLEKHGKARVVNAPICEQGIVAFSIGMASVGYTVISEIQFADYIFPAFDQIHNEAAKYRYKSGGQFDVGGLTIRTPCSAVGHGGHYHSQSPEAFFAHSPGLYIAVPRDPVSAKGLLASCIESPNPTLFFEPKILYRQIEQELTEEQQADTFRIPLGKAETVRQGEDVTLLAWGTMVRVCEESAKMAEEKGHNAEVIDLRSIIPWDKEKIFESVKRTGKCIIVHEAPITNGFGAELAASIQQHCFSSLESPIKRVCQYDLHTPLALERFTLPDKWKVYDAILETMEYE